MKKLLIFLFVLVGIVVGFPLTLLWIMSDSDGVNEMPTHLYTDDADAIKMMLEDLDESLETLRNDQDADLDFKLHQDVVNTWIFQTIRGDENNPGVNPDYLPDDDCDGAACKYIIEQESGGNHFRLLGVWVDFDDDEAVLKAALQLQRGDDGFTYNTTVASRFSLLDRDEDYRIAFEGFRVGSLPLSSGLFSRLIGLVERFSGDIMPDTDDLPLGKLDVRDFSFTIGKSELTDWLRDTDEEEVFLALAGEQLDVMFKNDMIGVKIDEGALSLSFAVSKIRNDDDTDIPAYLYDLHDEDGYNPDKFDAGAHMEKRFEEFVFNYSLGNTQYFTLKESTFNKILYDSFEGFEGVRMEREIERNGNVETMHVGLEALWFEFGDDDIVVKALFAMDTVKSLLEITFDKTDSTNESYTYELTVITMGKDEGETVDEYLSVENLDAFKTLLADVGDVYFGYFDEEGRLNITADRLDQLMEDGATEDSMSVDEIEIVERAIKLHISLEGDYQAAMDAFAGGIRNAFATGDIGGTLTGLLNVQNEGPEKDTVEKVQALQDKLEDDPDADIDEEEIQDLFESYEQMDPEAQETFMQAFEDSMDESIVNQFKDLFQD